MPLFLAKRNAQLKEIMDDPDCDAEKLTNTYRQFPSINALLSRTRSVYQHWIRPIMTDPARTYSLLDIGFGGGDIALKLAQWSAEDGLKLNITGVEIDQRAFHYVQTLSWPANVSFRLIDVKQLLDNGERFDFVTSNHLLHHLDESEFQRMLQHAASLSKKLVVFVDLNRSDLAYLLFAILSWPVFGNSYIHHDGLVSIRRSYTYHELAAVAPPGWQVQRLFPFRLLLNYRNQPAQ